MKILSAKEKTEVAIQILDGLKTGTVDETESLTELEKLNENELNSNLGQFLRDSSSIAKSLALRPIAERTAEPLLVHALSGLRTRAKTFLVEPEE